LTNKPLTCIILDDEPSAVKSLTLLLAEIPAIVILGAFIQVADAENQLIHEIPDVIFMDIRMPGKSGFDLLDEWRSKGITSEIVFVTAFDQYAIMAIRKSVADYLMKPVGHKELGDCLMRLRCKLQAAQEAAKPPVNQKIRFNTRSGCVFIDPREVLYIEADVNYSHIFMRDGTRLTVSQHLGKVAELIGIESLTRITRSLMLNLEHVRQVNSNPPKVVFGLENGITELQVPLVAARRMMK
jgi:two-component system LytT family response regulator